MWIIQALINFGDLGHGIIYLVRMQNSPKYELSLPPDTHMLKMLIFRELLAYLLNEWPLRKSLKFVYFRIDFQSKLKEFHFSCNSQFHIHRFLVKGTFPFSAFLKRCSRPEVFWRKGLLSILYLSVFSPNAGKYGPEKLRIWTLFMQRCIESIER